MTNEQSLIILGIIAGIFLLIVVFGIREEKRRLEKIKKIIKKRYGKAVTDSQILSRIEYIKGYNNKHLNNDCLDDITWNDLGMDELFKRMDNTYSSAGEEYLYYLLRNPVYDEQELDIRSADIDYFSANENARMSVYVNAALVGKTKSYSIYDYLDNKNDSKINTSNIGHYAIWCALAISVILLFTATGYGIVALIASLCIAVFSYFINRNKVLEYMTSFKYVMRLYNSINKLGNDKDLFSNDYLKRQKDDIDTIINAMKSFAGKSKYVFASEASSGSILAMFLEYFNMVFHLDLIMFNHMIRDFNSHEEEIDKMVTVLGYLEAMCAVASYRACFSSYCKPVFGKKVYAKGIYHPFLTDPVKNDYDLSRPMLLTGSNASGKSTFLKTVAMNTVLAQTVNIAFAEEFNTQFYHVYSSMALSDNIYKGESYFIVEIKAIQRIAHKQNTENIMCFVDEVLRGTNTVERIAASTQILKSFAVNNVMCIAATHDIELTSLLSDYYDNYHFEEEIIDNDVKFNYKLMSGKSKTRNAIKLLGLIGYEDSIIKSAEDMAKTFTATNKWEMR